MNENLKKHYFTVAVAMDFTKTKYRSIRHILTNILLVFFIVASAAAAEQTAPVTVFAAASTTNAINDIIKLFMEKKNVKIVTSFASSSTLAKQIENGAPANIFISADKEWMDYLAERKMIIPSSRVDLLGNRLVLIAPIGSPVKVDIAPGFDLAKLLKDSKLAMGDPDHVPVGIYGKQSMEKLGVWQSVQDKIARTNDVRSALVLVERGEVPLGVVYATDAAISGKVKIAGVFPEDSHSPIVYPIATVSGNETPSAKLFFEFLKTPEAAAVFKKYGFSVR